VTNPVDERTVAFADLAGYTALTEAHGETAARSRNSSYAFIHTDDIKARVAELFGDA
jgi:hypothetical protein